MIIYIEWCLEKSLLIRIILLEKIIKREKRKYFNVIKGVKPTKIPKSKTEFNIGINLTISLFMILIKKAI